MTILKSNMGKSYKINNDMGGHTKNWKPRRHREHTRQLHQNIKVTMDKFPYGNKYKKNTDIYNLAPHGRQCNPHNNPQKTATYKASSLRRRAVHQERSSW